MLAKVMSGAVVGVDGMPVTVEVDIAFGLPAFSTVGLPEGAVRESKERVKAAIKNSGYEFPNRRITVNLAPADLKKAGTGYDLPMAVGILAAVGLFTSQRLEQCMFLGELSLDGSIRQIPGILPMVMAARALGLPAILVPQANLEEAAVVDGIDVIGVDSLATTVAFLAGQRQLSPARCRREQLLANDADYGLDFQEVKGQEQAKRVLEIAAAGNHNVLMQGPPGSGKTMLARRLPTILPPMTFDEALETTKIYSVLGLLPAGRGLISQRPFRHPHHTISDAGLIGGGQQPRPGEVSCAHNGVLFLDELPEFRKNVLEVLRQPMEDGQVTIARASAALAFPANFMLLAAMNPCPCGFLTDPRHDCLCTPHQIQRYQSKISGPLLDRIDLVIEVSAVPYNDLAALDSGDSSATIRSRVQRARVRQQKRFATGHNTTRTNSQMQAREIKLHCRLDPDSQQLLEQAVHSLGLSARAFHRILKISRTIADLAGADHIGPQHISEAVQYRRHDRKKQARPMPHRGI